MWKITIEYDDHSKCVLKGKHKDIPLRLAINTSIGTVTAFHVFGVFTSNIH